MLEALGRARHASLISTAGVELSVSAFAGRQWHEVRPLWARLASASPYTTFFLDTPWLDSWLDVFDTPLQPRILVVHRRRDPVAACLLVSRRWRYQLVPVQRLYLNTSGEDPGDSACLQFNNLLCLEGEEQAAAEALAAFLSTESWDELALDGFCPGPPLEALRAAFSGLRHKARARTNYFVDLQRLREGGAGYEAILGPRTRARLRQNDRVYGDVVVEEAKNLSSAQRMLEELVALQRDRWQSRGEPGGFGAPRAARFHQAMLRNGFLQGGIQMIRCCGGGSLISVVYNYVRAGEVYCQQSGLADSTNKRLRPGAVAIGTAVAHCLADPSLRRYNLMPGDDHAKAPLATGSNQLEWLLLQRPSPRVRLVELLRRLKQRLVAAAPGDGPPGLGGGSE